MDHFARLDLPRQAWIEPELIKQRFLTLSAECHPDKARSPEDKHVAEQAFKELNESYNVVRNPRTRIVHLLELEEGVKAPHVQNVPQQALEFFAPVAEITRRADELLKQKASALSPMMKAQLFEKGLEVTDSLQALQGRIAARLAAIESELKSFPHEAAGPDKDRLREIAATLGFLDRWQSQLQERVAGLAF